MSNQVVVVAVIELSDGRFLISKRKETQSFPDLWEHPGGKVEPGETKMMGLYRELYEELDITVVGSPPLFIGRFDVDVPVCSKYTEVHCYLVSSWMGVPKPKASAEIKIVSLEEADKLDGMPGFKKINQMYKQMLLKV